VSLLDRLTPGRFESPTSSRASAVVGDSVFATRALRKFVQSLASREQPILIDLGPVVGSNVSFFGEELGCKIYIEDLLADLDRHTRQGKLDQFPEFLSKRFPQGDGTIDGILCWDVIDFLDRRSAQELARQLMRLLSSNGALLGFFGTTLPKTAEYTRHVIVDAATLKQCPYGAARGRRVGLPNRDIQRLFGGLRVSDSFLLKNSCREILFKQP
jgi:hypothetical protein